MTRTTRKGGAPVGDKRTGQPLTRGGATARRRPVTRSLPRWLPPTSLGLALAGLAVSAYLTFEHYTQGDSLACPEGQVVNCQKVTQSEFATFLGLPVALLGLLYFVALVVLCLPALWRRAALDLPRLTLVGVGVAMVAYLVWAEVVVGAICLWCTVVHVVTLLLLFVLLFGRALTPARRP